MTIEQYKKKQNIPPVGTPCQILTIIASKEECGGFLVKPEYLEARKAGTKGTTFGWVPGAGGDVWWVKHEDGTIGAYLYTEVTDPSE